jgi:hypothetical protein
MSTGNQLAADGRDVAHLATAGRPIEAIRTHIWIVALGCWAEACLKARLMIKVTAWIKLSEPYRGIDS